MNYEEIKKKEGLRIAINQAIHDTLNNKITGGDLLDIIFELHPENKKLLKAFAEWMIKEENINSTRPETYADDFLSL